MVKKYVIEDLKRVAKYDVNFDALPPDIRSQIEVLSSKYTELAIKKNDVIIFEKSPIKKMMKKDLYENEKKDLQLLQKEYEKTLNITAEQIIIFFSKKHEKKPEVYFNVDTNELIKNAKEDIPTMCHKCGAPLNIDYENNIAICDYCGSEYQLTTKKIIDKLFGD